MPTTPPFFHHKQRGAALLLLLIIVVVGAAFLLNALKNNPNIERDKVTADALAKAKEGLIGYAATYRDTHPSPGPVYDQVFGYLPCPDTNNDGVADTPCGTTDAPVVGRLPWKTLGLPPLRDSGGECLWYAVSGTYKNNPATGVLNWDTNGQFIIQDETGAIIAGATAEARPAAIIFSPGTALAGQDRTPAGTSECGGNSTLGAYLEGNNAFVSPPVATPSTTITLTSGTSGSAANNDRSLWIMPADIFNRIKKRSDFATDIANLLTDIVDQAAKDDSCAAAATLDPPAAGIAGGGVSGKTVGMAPTIIGACLSTDLTKRMAVFNNWRNNVLYATCPSSSTPCLTVNGNGNCVGAVIFSGERASGTTRPSTDASNYLEGNNLSAFTSSTTTLNGAGPYNWITSTQDIAVCIPPVGGGATQVTFSNPTDFAKFATAIAGVGVTVDPASQTMSIDVAGGSGGGCAWFPEAMTLNGKTLRAYYTFQFAHDDPIGAVDLGYGFTLSLLEGDLGMPTTCGTQSRMGVVPASDRPFGLFVETDIHQATTSGEPNGTPNHTAIMLNGNVDHSTTGGSLTSACNGTSYGCLHSPDNKFEESPTPTEHKQRIEIHTGYNSSCTTSGGTYALAKVWVDCVACSDTSADFAATPTASRCFELVPQMDTFYFGFTGGFSSSGGNVQGVSIRNLDLRVE